MALGLSLKSRLALAYASFVFIAGIVAFGAYYYFVLPGYVLLEQQDARHHMERLLASIDKEVVMLDRLVRDYAFWDDTCNYVATRDPDYLESNFLNEMFVDNHISSVAIYNVDGHLIYSKGVNLSTGVERQLDDPVCRSVVNLKPDGLLRPVSGIVLDDDGLQMVAARTIMGSDGQGAVHGTLVFTRPFDVALINDLSRQFRLDISLVPLNNRTSVAARQLLKQITKTTPILIEEKTPDKLHVFAELHDLEQNEVAYLQLNLPRKLYAHTRSTMLSALGFALGGIVILALVMGSTIRKMVLKPFNELSDLIHLFRKNQGSRLPVALAHEGEIGGLVQEFNYLLTDLEESRSHRTFSEEKTDLIKRVVPSAIFTVDKKKVITGWNERAERITGYSAEEMIGSTCFLFAQAPCQEQCGLYDDGVCKPIMGRECTIRHKDGSILTISKNADYLRDAQGEVIGGIECFEDITSRKRSEEALQWEVALNSRLAKLSNSILHNAGNVRAVARELLEYARNITGSRQGFVAELDESGGQVLWEHTALFRSLPQQDGLPTIPAPATGRGSLLNTVYKRQTAVYFNALERLSILNLADGINDEIVHFMAVPVANSERIIGQVALVNNEGGYTKRDLQAVEQLAELFAVVLSQPRQAALLSDGHKPPVTGLEVCQQ